jgi:hypothetical protein
MTRLIGLTGLAGSGKDTVRGLLERFHGYNGLAFADPLRGMLASLLKSAGHNPTWMVDREMKEREIPTIGVSYRVLAQTLGTEWGRSIDPDLWVKIAASRIASIPDEERVVISDVRFPNEVASIKSQGGVIIRIIRPGVEPVRSHVSESNVGDLDWDYTILNNGSIDDLRYAIDRGLEYLERSQEAA